MSQTASRVIRNTGYLYIKMGITMFISLYTTRLILNSLGASDFGIFNIVGGAIAMLGFLNSAMAGATQRFMSYAQGEGNKSRQNDIFNVSCLLHFFIALCIGFILLAAGWFFFNGILNIPQQRIFAAKTVYASLIISTVFTVMTVPYDAVMNAHENMLYYSIVGIIESLLKLAVALAVVYSPVDRLILYGALMACIPLITLTIMRIYCHRKYPECSFSSLYALDLKLMKEMSTFAGWNLFSSASIMISNYGLGIVVNMFYGVILNTALGIAQQIDAQLKVFSNTMLKALNPVITKSQGEGSQQKMLNISLTGSKFSFFMFSFFVIPAFIEMPVLLRFWLKQVPDWCILFCRLQLIVSLFGQLGATINSAIYAHGKIRSFTIISSVLYLSSISLTYIFYKTGCPVYFMYISILILNVISYRIAGIVILHRHCDMPYSDYCHKVLYPCVTVFSVSFLCSLLPAHFMQEGLLRVMTVGAVSCLSFALTFYHIGLNSQERTLFAQLLRGITQKLQNTSR